MKKFISGLLVGFAIATCGLIYADGTLNTQLASFKVLVNGQEYNNAEMPAVTVNDRTYLPVKGIGDALGVPVAWNQSENRVEVGKKVEKVAVIAKGNVLDTGEGFIIKFIGHQFVIAAETFDIEVTNTTDKPITYDMANLSLSGHELIQRDTDLKSGTLEPGKTAKGTVKFRTMDPGDGTYKLKYKNSQTQLNVSGLK